MLFSEIFKGSPTMRGVLLDDNKNYISKPPLDDNGKAIKFAKQEYQPFDPEAHLEGKIIQGFSPVNELTDLVSICCWDLDNLELTNKSFEQITKIIWKDLDDEMFCIKSMSGDMHIYKHLNKEVSSQEAGMIAKDVEKKLKKIFPTINGVDIVDDSHSLPKYFNIAEKKPGYWIYAPYGVEGTCCYSPGGNPLTLKQFEFRDDVRQHPLIASAIGLRAKQHGGRHKALFNIALYLRFNDVSVTLEQVNEHLHEPVSFNGLHHAKKSSLKYSKIHLEKNLVNYMRDITGIDYEFVPKVKPIPEVPSDLWEQSISYTKDLDSVTKDEPGQTDVRQTHKKLIGYDINEYRNLNIPKPNFLMERLFKEKSINFISGPKGKGKSEFTLGILNSLVRGTDFLMWTCPNKHPVCFIDGEMDPYDLIERDSYYLERLFESEKDMFHVIQYALQINQVIPDIKTEHGQQLILDYLMYQEKLTGKKPVVVLDNLRSLSAYKENESDEWHPIGKWLLKLRGLGYTSIVIDHHGKAGGSPRGSSSKTDWANVSLLIDGDRQKNNPNMRIKITFDKARGLRPDDTEAFYAEYNFKGHWSIAEGPKNADEIELKDKLRRLMKATDPKLTQEQMGENLGISAGKVNGLVKKIKQDDKDDKNIPF